MPISRIKQRPAKCNFPAWKIRRLTASETLAIAHFKKRVMAWNKGIRASVYGITLKKPSQQTS